MAESIQRDRRAETFYRTLTLDRAAAQADQRQIAASLSSELAVDRWFGQEILVHSADAVDLTRATDGLPLLFNHDSNQPIGLVEDVHLEGAKLRGMLRFSRNAKAEEVWQDVQDGLLRNLSIGYQIHDWIESNDSDLVKVIRWTLVETSIAPVPADPTVGIGRSFSSPVDNREVDRMTTETQAPGATPPAPESPMAPVVDLTALRRDQQIMLDKGREVGVKAERQRVADIAAIFDLGVIPKASQEFAAEFVALRAKALDEGWTVDQTRDIVLRALGRLSAPVADARGVTDEARGLPHPDKPLQAAGGGRPIRMGEDALDKFKTGVDCALTVRAGLNSSREAVQKAREGGFLGFRLSRLAEHYLRLIGEETRHLDDEGVAHRALTTRAQGLTTSDFANLLLNTANKALMLGWDQAPETWQQWVRIGTVPDFKSAARVGLSGFTSLTVVPEDGEISYGKFTDRKETIQAVSYAKKFRLTYQAIKNDDLNAFTVIPRGMGRAAQSIIGDMVYGILNGVGPTLNQDSTALFDTSTHKNYVAASTAPTTATMETAYKAMALQTDPNTGKVLNIVPRYLIVPKSLEITARQLVASEYDPNAAPGSTSGKNVFAPNPFRNRAEVISDGRLDGQTNGTAAWYLAGDPNIFDTVEVAFVDGVALPYLKEQDEWDTRGVEWVVGVDFGVAALDFRALHKYRGS